jgi:hypothetical protein
LGRLLLVAGAFLVIAGLAVMGLERLGIHLGRLPGDIRVEGKHGGIYFPVVTCILVSVVVSLIGWLFRPR